MHEGDAEQKDVFKGLLEKVDGLDHEDVYGEPNVDADELLWLAMMQWSALLGDGLKRVALFESGGDDFEGGKAASVARSKEALLSCDHLSRLAIQVGLRPLTHVSTHAQRDHDDVAAYQLAMNEVESAGRPALDAASAALRWRVFAGLHGATGGAPLRHDHERAKRQLQAAWTMYETPVNSFIKELVQKFSDPEALAAAGKGALADRIALLQRHLTTLQQTFQQIRDVTNAQNISIEQKGLAEEFLDVAHPFKRLLKSCAEANDTGEVPSAENLCELERLAWVEFRVFMGEVFAVQVEVAPARSRDRTEIVRDSWAGGDAHSSAPPARRASNAGLKGKLGGK